MTDRRLIDWRQSNHGNLEDYSDDYLMKTCARIVITKVNLSVINISDMINFITTQSILECFGNMSSSGAELDMVNMKRRTKLIEDEITHRITGDSLSYRWWKSIEKFTSLNSSQNMEEVMKTILKEVNSFDSSRDKHQSAGKVLWRNKTTENKFEFYIALIT